MRGANSHDVTLLVHPHTEEEVARMGISSIYGSAKATKEEGLVLIFQSDGKYKLVEVKKNRYDGTLGHCPIYFDRGSGKFLDHAPEECNASQGGPRAKNCHLDQDHRYMSLTLRNNDTVDE